MHELISVSLVAETSSGGYNFHRWTCKLSDDYFLNSKRTCKPPELHTIMKECNGTGWYWIGTKNV